MTAAASAIRQPARPLGRAVDAVRSDPFWWWVLGCGAVGLVLRLVWVFYAARVPAGLYDPARYFGIAANIAHGRGYADVFTIRNGVPVPGEPSAYYPPVPRCLAHTRVCGSPKPSPTRPPAASSSTPLEASTSAATPRPSIGHFQ